MGYEFFLPMVLRWRASRAEAPLWESPPDRCWKSNIAWLDKQKQRQLWQLSTRLVLFPAFIAYLNINTMCGCVWELLWSLVQESSEEYGNVRSKTVAYLNWNTGTGNRKIGGWIWIPGIFDSQILTVSSRRRSRLHILVAKTFASRGEASTGPRTATT